MVTRKFSFRIKTAKRMRIALVLFTCIFRQAFANTEANIGEWFERHSGNPLDIPLYAAFGVVHPDILFFPDGEDAYNYWMFYTPYPPESFENPSLVRSSDGINFTDAGVRNPLIIATEPWENRHLADPDVIRVGNTWYMYYMGRDGVGTACIGLAISEDGKNWTKYERNPVLRPTQAWENDWVGAPALHHDGSKFWMWFCGGYTKGIELASSIDGKDWIRENNGDPTLTGTIGEWDAGGVSHPDVIYCNDTLWMYYCGVSGVGPQFRLGLAKSVDKFNWVKCEYNPVLDTMHYSWEGYHIYRSSPIIFSDTMWLHYSAYDDTGTFRPGIGWAKSWDKRGLKEVYAEEPRTGEKTSEFALFQNYPNPFNQSTRIEFSLAKPGFVSLAIYNVRGRKVRSLVSQQLSAGQHSVEWNGKNNSGRDVASGTYFFKLKVGKKYTETKKMVFLK